MNVKDVPKKRVKKEIQSDNKAQYIVDLKSDLFVVNEDKKSNRGLKTIADPKKLPKSCC